MNEKVQIKGNVGVAVNAEDGAAVHIHVAETDEKQSTKKLAIHELLNICEEADCQRSLEKISKQLYGSALFKRLTLEQLGTLQIIANEFERCSQREKNDSHAIFTQEMDEYEDFYRRMGIRASKAERVALTSLMQRFNPEQVKLAWNNNTLFYRDDKLCTRSELLQFWLGVVVTILSGLLLVMFFLALTYKGIGVVTLKLVAQQCMLGVTLWVAVRYMVAPTFLAKRMRQVVDIQGQRENSS